MMKEEGFSLKKIKNMNHVVLICGIIILICAPLIFVITQSQPHSMLLPDQSFKINLQTISTVLPLIVVFILLCFRVEMLIAGSIGLILTLVIGGVGFNQANEAIMGVMPTMFNSIPLIIDAALVYILMQIGSYSAIVVLLQRVIKITPYYIIMLAVAVVGFMTFFSGNPTGSILLISPVIVIMCGFLPDIIVALSAVATVSVLLSPQSVERAMITSVTNYPVFVNSSVMFITFLFVIVLVVAFLYVRLLRVEKNEVKMKVDVRFAEMPVFELLRYVGPFVFLICSVHLESFINNLIGITFITPISYMIGTLFFICLCNRLYVNDVVQMFLVGSGHLLSRLFQVAFFFACMNLIGDVGGFRFMTAMFEVMPTRFMLFAAICMSIIIALPGAVYVSFVLELMLPFVVHLGFSPLEILLVSMGAMLGSQLCVANMTLQVLSIQFEQSVFEIIKANKVFVTIGIVILSFVAIIGGTSLG